MTKFLSSRLGSRDCTMNDSKTCIVCGMPRDGDRLWCGNDACLEVAKTLPTHTLNEIRMKEALEALPRIDDNGMPVHSGVYIHFTERKENGLG